MPTKKRRLKRNHSIAAPDRIIVFDCEANRLRGKGAGGGDLDVLRLGWVCCYRLKKGKPTCEFWHEFRNPSEFWAVVEGFADHHAVNWIVAQNINYDLTLVKFWEALDSAHFSLDSPGRKRDDSPPPLVEAFGRGGIFIRADPPTVIGFCNRQGGRFLAVDLMNYLPMPLAKIGESIGKPKGRFPGFNATDAELSEYCRNDVEILMEAFNALVAMVKESDLGKFQFTASSQAMSAFRHRLCYSLPIMHDNLPAKKLVRRGYFGGDTRLFRHGKYKGKVYQVDVNALYPTVMLDNIYPCNLIGHTMRADWKPVSSPYPLTDMIAEVRIETRTNTYPVRLVPMEFIKSDNGNDVIYRVADSTGYVHEIRLPPDSENPTQVIRNRRPITVHASGKFETVLCGPELALAVARGNVKAMRSYSAYEMAPMFEKYVTQIQEMRDFYRRAGKPAFALYAKQLLNGLYGKWGQKTPEFELCEDMAPERTFDTWAHVDNETGERTEFHSVGHHVFKQVEPEEQPFSLPSVSAFVASYARIFMERARWCAGPDNVLYQSTDSLIVTREGFNRLHTGNYLHETEMGKFKLEAKGNGAIIRGMHNYTIGKKVVCSAKRIDARRVDGNKYTQENYTGLKTVCRVKPQGGLEIHSQIKRLTGGYNHGILLPFGHVSPFTLENWS